jgi:parallel beta-helix repeat protein
MGSSQTGIRHIVQNNVAWKNKAAGFYANHSSGGNTWYNNTAYSNGVQYNMLASSFDAAGNITGTIVLTGSKVHILRNNVGFPAKNSNMDGVDSGHNTWDLSLGETGADFANTDPTGCDGPRQANGSMPAACTFMKLKVGSPLIDKGTDVGLPFAGAAPDLGAYEYGALPSTGGAGGSAAGGSTGTGGVASTGGGSGAGDAGAGGVLGSGGASRSDAGDGGNAAGTSGAADGTTTVAVGGSTSGGGAVASGGNMAAGGMTNSGGLSGVGGSSNAGGSRATGGGSSSGCGCALGGVAVTSHRTMLTLVALGLLLRRRMRR